MSPFKDVFFFYFITILFYKKKPILSHSQLATGTLEDWSPPYISKKSSSYKNFIREKMTGRVDNIPRRLFEKKCKNVKIEVSGPKELHFFTNFSENGEKRCFFGYCHFNFILFAFFFLRISTLPVILSFMNFLKLELKKKTYISGYPILVPNVPVAGWICVIFHQIEYLKIKKYLVEVTHLDFIHLLHP